MTCANCNHPESDHYATLFGCRCSWRFWVDSAECECSEFVVKTEEKDGKTDRQNDHQHWHR